MLTADYGMHARDAVEPGAVGNGRRRTSVTLLVTCSVPTLPSLSHCPVGMELDH